jgi:hypothetical protein
MKKLALNPYWSKIGLAIVNWLFLVSPNVSITILSVVLETAFVGFVSKRRVRDDGKGLELIDDDFT